MIIKKYPAALFLTFLLMMGIRSQQLLGQVVPSATKSSITLTAGGIVSAFDPAYVQPKLIGGGAFVDLNLFHGVGIEAEGRWLRINEVSGISQDNYLAGPRVKLRHFWKATPYVKALGGFSNMNFQDGIGTGRFTALAFGGGVDIHLNRRWSVRAIDAEYQYWPSFLGGSLSPYGLSSGISYRIF
jgi:hypothetical protein